nr:hypothetical protein [Candidatus Sigynarchaeota archaeon]
MGDTFQAMNERSNRRHWKARWRLLEARPAAWNHLLACASARSYCLATPVQILITASPADCVDEPSGTRANRGWCPARFFRTILAATIDRQKTTLSPLEFTLLSATAAHPSLLAMPWYHV